MTIPQERREELRRLAEDATPGPWVTKTCEPCAEHGREDIQIWDERGHIPIAQWMDEIDPDAGDDAAFIAASRQAVPELLDALTRAEAQSEARRINTAYWKERELNGWETNAELKTALDQAEARIADTRALCDEWEAMGTRQMNIGAIRRALDAP